MFLIGDRMVDPALAGESILSFLLYLLEGGRGGLLGSQVLPSYWLPLGKPGSWEKGVHTASPE